ncbi:MAG: ABC transporter ATP-binding protein [Rhizobiaceae bacterium]
MNATIGNTQSGAGDIVAVIRRVFRENGRRYVRDYVLAAVCLMLVAGTTFFIAWIMSPVINNIFVERRVDLIAITCAGIVAAFLIRGAAAYGQGVLLAKVGNNIVARYQKRVFDHLMRLGVGFYGEERSGQLAARINENINGIRDLLNITLNAIARDAFMLVGLLAVMVYQDPLLSAIALVIAPPMIWSVNYLMRRVRTVAREAVVFNSRVVGAMQEATQGITVIKAFTMEEQLSGKIAEVIRNAEARANKIARVYERTAPIAEWLAGLAIAGVVAYGGYRVAVYNVPPGDLFSFLTALMLAYDPARRLAKMQVTLERSLVNARMIYEILDIVPQQGDVEGAAELKVGAGEIRFDEVRFAYASDLPVLDGVSFTAGAGQTTAIVGASGAGKTTLIALLQRFYDPASGTIAIDGQDIATVTKQSLRGSIAYVSQAPYLFEGSIADNIRYGRPDASMDDVRRAAQLAQAEEFILQQPQGYDTPVGESGSTLSGGQRQRLSIARALLRDAPILLLDEATSALDNESEKAVQAALESVMKDRTTIVIAHRLSTVVKADMIVVLHDGHLIEHGTHDELVGRKGGLYARLHRLGGGTALELVDDVDGGADTGGKRAGGANGRPVRRAVGTGR